VSRERGPSTIIRHALDDADANARADSDAGASERGK